MAPADSPLAEGADRLAAVARMPAAEEVAGARNFAAEAERRTPAEEAVEAGTLAAVPWEAERTRVGPVEAVARTPGVAVGRTMGEVAA